MTGNKDSRWATSEIWKLKSYFQWTQTVCAVTGNHVIECDPDADNSSSAWKATCFIWDMESFSTEPLIAISPLPHSSGSVQLRSILVGCWCGFGPEWMISGARLWSLQLNATNCKRWRGYSCQHCVFGEESSVETGSFVQQKEKKTTKTE